MLRSFTKKPSQAHTYLDDTPLADDPRQEVIAERCSQVRGTPPVHHEWRSLGLGHPAWVGYVDCLAVALYPAAAGGVEILQPIGFVGP